MKGKPKKPTNRNQGYLASLHKQELNLKSHLMMMILDFKKNIDNFLKEIQENKSKQTEALKELEENTTKQVKELNKTIQI